MKFFKNIAIIVILFTIIAIASLNIIATDYDGSYNSYNITLEYPGYFIDEVTVSCPSGYKPDWDNIITYGSSVLTDIKILAGDRDVVCIQINDPNNTFFGSTFKLKHEGNYVLIYDLVSDNALYYLELVDSGNTFTIYGRNGVNYYFDKPNNTTTWFEYISNLESPHRDMFYFVEDFVFFNDYALKYENEFVRISDIIFNPQL